MYGNIPNSELIRGRFIAMKDYITALIIITGITLVSGTAGAGIYKYLDENGKVVYGDKPVAGAKKMKVRRRPEPVAERREEFDDSDGGQQDDLEEVTKYDSLELLSPKNDKVVLDRTGSVQVILMPAPRLSSTHELIINVDGKDISRGKHSNLNLQGMSRGTHTVSARIVDANGIELIASPTAIFHVKRPTADDELAYR